MLQRQPRRQKISDEDFCIFKREMSALRRNYTAADEEKKIQIKNELTEAIRQCQAHIGGLKYSAGHDVSRTFASFYTPRLKLLQKTISSLQ